MIAAAPLVALALAAGSECGLPALREGALPFRPGELLAYDVDLVGVVQMGTLSLAVEPPISRGSLYPLRARIRNASVFAKIRRVRGYALSWVDVRTLRPQRYRDEAEEDGVHKSTDTRLDRPGPVVMAWALGARQGTASMTREREVLDLLSSIYYLRAAQLAPGAALCFDLVANRRFWRLRATVAEASERVETGAGAYDATRVDAVLTRADGGGPPRSVHFWFSRDARRLPLAAVGEIDLGPVRATLSRSDATGAREPPDGG